jgi:hypothetical protein
LKLNSPNRRAGAGLPYLNIASFKTVTTDEAKGGMTVGGKKIMEAVSPVLRSKKTTLIGR